MRTLTAIGADRKALVVRVVGRVRTASPELSYDTVLEATTAAGYFPQLLPSAYRHTVELDLRHAGEGTLSAYAACARQIDALTSRIHDGVAQEEVHRLAVFGFARIPLLVYLGARLDDKVPALIFQRQRVNDHNAWRWPETSLLPDFTIRVLEHQAGANRPILVLNISGTIPLADLPPAMEEYGPIYVVEPVLPAVPGPTVIDSPMALAALEQTLRTFLASIEQNHGRIESLPVFGAVPVSAAITLGRVLMPDVSPTLKVFDRDDTGTFFLALEVAK